MNITPPSSHRDSSEELPTAFSIIFRRNCILQASSQAPGARAVVPAVPGVLYLIFVNHMKVTAVHTETMEPGDPATEPAPYVFWPVLMLAVFLGFLIRVEVGRKTSLSFDEWQHVFMAASARWTDLSFELRTNSHPPLFFLLLRGIERLGIAFYRSISIAAGVGCAAHWRTERHTRSMDRTTFGPALRPAREFGTPVADLVQAMPYVVYQSIIDAEFAGHGLHSY